MTKSEVMALLQENRNERGIASWKRIGRKGLTSHGIGLTQLRKLAKQVGRDHKLAGQLCKSNVYDARVLGALIDEPGKMTRKQAEAQVEDLRDGMLAHVYCSCDATLARTSFARELAVDWMDSDDDLRRRCGYLLLYELGKNKKDKALDDAFFTGYIDRIQETIHEEENWVRDAMNASLLSIGKRNKKLNRAALKAAKSIGPVQVDYGDNSCEPPNIVKHLTSPSLREKLGRLTKEVGVSDDRKVFTFSGEKVDVDWDGRLCIHVGECTRARGALFQSGRKPWGEPDWGEADYVAEVVGRCPTGALVYRRKDGGPEETAPDANTVTVANNGPLYVEGDLKLQDAPEDMPGLRYRAALCRCGGSTNKPYCDNTHETNGFRDRGALGESGDGFDRPGGPLEIRREPNGPLSVSGSFTIRTGSGRAGWTGKQAILCRCGASNTKPFCDWSHVAAGFEAD